MSVCPGCEHGASFHNAWSRNGITSAQIVWFPLNCTGGHFTPNIPGFKPQIRIEEFLCFLGNIKLHFPIYYPSSLKLFTAIEYIALGGPDEQGSPCRISPYVGICISHHLLVHVPKCMCPVQILKHRCEMHMPKD